MIKFLVKLIVRLAKRFPAHCRNNLQFVRLDLRGSQLTFGTGVYAGIYASQNYEVPRVDEPAKIWERIQEFADSHKKK